MADTHNTPVLVGIAQLEQRIGDPVNGRIDGKEPLELMIDAVRQAAADAGSSQLLGAAGAVRVIRGSWPYKNPAKAVAEAIDNPTAETGLSPFGGNFVQSVLSQSALDIQSGAHEIIVITGAECGNMKAKARRAGIKLDWQLLPGKPDRLLGEDKPMQHEAEAARGLQAPIQMYPMFENALRYANGESIDQHLARVAELWSGFSRVAAKNPHAWIQREVSAEEIRTPSAQNRPVSFPYPKLMNSNNNVDQAAALILTSTVAARRLGIDPSKWIYPWVGTDAHDTYFVSTRDNLHSSPAIRFAGRRALELAGLEVADVDHVDVYSCFPSAVQVSANELGLDQAKPLTVTGGLTFGGGPLNNYVMHAIARMAEVLRASPGDRGLVTANGGYITKHAFGVYSTEPPATPFRHEDLQARVDQEPVREVAMAYAGPVEIETYTVMYGSDGPVAGHAACRLPDGRRAWGNTADRSVLDAMTEQEFCGRPARLTNDGAVEF